MSPHHTSLGNIRLLPSRARAAPCSSHSSGSADPHSHASPALFATSTSLMQRVPRTETRPHRLVIAGCSHLLPDVTALGSRPCLTYIANPSEPAPRPLLLWEGLAASLERPGRAVAGAAGDVVEEIRVWRGRGEGRAPKAAQSLHPAQGLLTAERGDAPVSAQRGAGGRWEGFLQTRAFTGERRKGSSLPLLQI